MNLIPETWATQECEKVDVESTSNKEPNGILRFEKILVGGCIVAMATFWASETLFTLSIISVTVMALLTLFWESPS